MIKDGVSFYIAYIFTIIVILPSNLSGVFTRFLFPLLMLMVLILVGSSNQLLFSSLFGFLSLLYFYDVFHMEE